MKPIVRVVAAISLIAAAIVAAAPAFATRTVTLSSMTPVAQVRGELTLLATLGPDDGSGLPGTPTIEQYLTGQWQPIGSANCGADGTCLKTVAPESSGNSYFRASLPPTGDQPAVISAPIRVYVYPDADKPFGSAEIPTVTGDQAVGTTLQAEPGSWSPRSDGFSYRWNRNGAWTGATGRRYTLTDADLGAYVTVTVVGWHADSRTVRDSRPSTRVVTGVFRSTAPEIVGRAVVGEPLQVVVDGWSPKPSTIAYQWLRDGVEIDGATSDRYVLAPTDVGNTLTVAVHATAPGVEPADVVSKPFVVPGRAGRAQRTFADVMHPASTEPWPAEDLTVTTGKAAPAWGALKRTAWDAAGAFTHSQTPQLAGTLATAMYGRPWTRSDTAEYPGTNVSLKNADVSFTVTARRFAIAYRGNEKSDAMVWVDGRPVAAAPLRGVGSSDATAANWIAITLPERRTAEVRFAGPLTFSGVEVPASENGTVSATPAAFTLGVLSDSYFEVCSDAPCMSRNAAPTLATLTGFRVWNMSESGTGYVEAHGPSVSGFEPSPFGSARRLTGLEQAPIDALMIGGSANDGFKPAELQQPAVDTLLTHLEEVRPDLPVVLLGIEPLTGAFRTQNSTTRGKAFTATLKSMVGRHQNVVGFIDPFTDPWVTGTGTIARPAGDGNADRFIGNDAVHLSAAGVQHYQQRIVDALRSIALPATADAG